MMRQMAPAASGVLIDAYYGAWSAIASEAIPPRQGDARPGREVGQPQEQGRRPDGRGRAGLERREDQADGGRRRQAAGPVRAGRADLGRAPVRSSSSTSTTSARSTTSCCCWRPVAFPFGGEKKTDAELPRPQGRDGHRVGPPAQPVLRRLQGRVPRHARATSPTSQLADNLHALDAASERPWVLLSAGVDYPDYFKQVEMAMECGCSGVLGGRAFWKEYFLQDGAEAADQVRRHDRPASGSPTSTPSSGRTAPPGSPGTASPRKTWRRSAPPRAGTPATPRTPAAAGGEPPARPGRARCIEPP